jgi:hypothetical protein
MGREVDNYKTNLLTTISRRSSRPVIKRAQKIWRLATLRCPAEPLAELSAGVGGVHNGRSIDRPPRIALRPLGERIRHVESYFRFRPVNPSSHAPTSKVLYVRRASQWFSYCSTAFKGMKPFSFQPEG